MAKKFYDLLMHGFIKMEDISLIIFDECHHTDQDHLYNLIMKDFFYHKFNPDDPNCKRPYILGLTASPIKQKIEQVVSGDIESMLQNLSNNLYSKFITISANQIQTIEKNLEIKILDYYSNFNENIKEIEEIEQNIIRYLANLIQLPEGSYKIHQGLNQGQKNKDLDNNILVQLLNQSTLEVSQLEQDHVVAQFLRGRKFLIELDCTVTKSQLDISQLPQQEDKVLIILLLIILKKINSLLIELGPLAVKTFLLDIKSDLIANNGRILGKKHEDTVKIIDNYCKSHLQKQDNSFILDSSQQNQISNKLQKLVQILNESYQQDPKLKTIIFVKDRSVACYLKKLLNGNKPASNLKQDYLCEGLLDLNLFRIGFAMGLKRISLINQAYRSTNIKNTDVFKDILNHIPSCKSIKLSQTEFKETLDNFNQGRINILIATNVVEEGLDVSTCNLVICLNELATVKAFIQMKGRARQINSKFVFLCAQEELQQVKFDQENFARVIDLMRLITLRGSQDCFENLSTTKSELMPLPNITQLKQQDPSSYLEEPLTGSKISMRDAKQLIEMFCLQFADGKIKITTEKAQDDQKYENNLDLKPNYINNETQKEGVKFYYSVLYMPMSCIHIFRKVNPAVAYVKKKDAENHVALLAVRKLRQLGHLDEYLFPQIKIQNLSDQSSIHMSEYGTPEKVKGPKAEKKPNNQDQLDLTQPRKKKQITDEQKSFAQEQSKKFHQQLKHETKNLDFDNLGNSFINKIKFFQEQQQNLQVLVFYAKSKDHIYPYKNNKDFLGILSNDIQICSPALKFTMNQEQKQMEKNLEHLKNLVESNLIKMTDGWQAEQSNEELTVVIDQKSAFNLWEDMKQQGFKNKLMALTMLQFFHTWSFYYLFSADHKFIKAILKHKFPFISLFQPEIDRLKSKKILPIVRNVYGEKTAKILSEGRKFKQQQQVHFAYSVPVYFQNGKFQVNWKLIERTINYMKNRLLELAMITERHIIISKYNLEEVVKQDKKKMIQFVWDNKFIGNRHVVLSSEHSSKSWTQPMDLGQGKNNETKQFIQKFKQDMLQLTNQSQSLVYNQSFYTNLQVNQSEFSIIPNQTIYSDQIKQKQIVLTTQEYYFLKQGQLQKQNFNKYIIKCRKERHFVDFGKKKRDETSQQYTPQYRQKQVNTVFDVPEQQLSLAPVSYNQYQMLQQSCYHFLNLNEFMLIDKFIRKFFSSSTSLFEMDNEHGYRPSKHTTRLLVTQDQIWREVKDEGSVHQLKTLDQLKFRLELVREALTAPSACRDYDYERLEFYGDSIIGFLVILELFLLNQSNTEGDLDFRRIERVSNENFYKVNKNNKFYKFMITEPHYVFSGFNPAAFDHFEQTSDTNLYYQDKITQKTYNELNNKLKELRIIKERLCISSKQDDDLKQMFLRGDMFTVIKMLLKDEQIVQAIAYKLTQHHSKIHDRDHSKNKECYECKCYQAKMSFESLLFKQDTESVLKAVKILGQAKIAPLTILKYCTQMVEKKISVQIKKQKESREKKIYENQRIASIKRKPIYFKQLADVVESVVGAVTIACGINLTQDFLLELNVLQHDQTRLQSEFSKLQEEARSKEAKLIKHFYTEFNFAEVEKIIGYTFQCKTFIVTALIHKSYIDQSVEQFLQMRLDDYERLEFLGDSVLNYMIAKHFFLTSQEDTQRKMPKELHKMKTAVINNALLSLIVIENGINQYIVYNKKAESFKQQFDKFVETVQKMVQGNSTIEVSKKSKQERESKALELDELYEHNLKIFGDVFESIIGAVFLDCMDTEKTWSILNKLIMPYITVYADLDTMQDHARTKLLELWNQKSYTKRFKCTHESSQVTGKDEITLTALIVGSYYSRNSKQIIFSEVYKKDVKNKTRAFYKILYGVVAKFIEQTDKKGENEEQRLLDRPDQVLEGLRKIINKQRSDEQKLKL